MSSPLLDIGVSGNFLTMVFNLRPRGYNDGSHPLYDLLCDDCNEAFERIRRGLPRVLKPPSIPLTVEFEALVDVVTALASALGR